MGHTVIAWYHTYTHVHDMYYDCTVYHYIMCIYINTMSIHHNAPYVLIHIHCMDGIPIMVYTYTSYVQVSS